ncbi:MAG TPA: hypothetical protein VMB51_09105 [Solirubrobacteraceae bacterium]|nr:hypothetical protein [Solirubrobacteraceae bacterium]
MSRIRLIETALLVLVGLLLALATVNDVVRQTHVNDRLIADLSTWRHYTDHDYKELAPDQHLLGESTKREVVCGNTAPGPQYARTQICLEIWGPVRAGRRAVHGGWYLPAKTEEDLRRYRYGCFGAAVSEGICSPAGGRA